MHLLVLSAFRLLKVETVTVPVTFQCTFWCSVLSDDPTGNQNHDFFSVSMHLLVLSAFRRTTQAQCWPVYGVSMHLLVLSAFRRKEVGARREICGVFQCTFWCSVLSDSPMVVGRGGVPVSMHLLVLSAFRPIDCMSRPISARFQCTFWCSVLSDVRRRLPYGDEHEVSMHLLVLSAFRRVFYVLVTAGVLFQCTFWCSVLSDCRSVEH